MRSKAKGCNVGIVTFPISKAGNVPLSNLVAISRHFSNHLYIITGNEAEVLLNKGLDKIYVFKIYHKSGVNAITRIVNYAYTQLRISYNLARLAGKVDLWIFFFGESLLLPMLIAKSLRKKIVLAFTGSAAKAGKARRDALAKAIAVLQNINYVLPSRIVIYSKRLIKEQSLEKFKYKISIGHEHFLDFNSFKKKKKIEERQNLVGYIGRLSQAKGVLNLIKAFPSVLEMRGDIRFLVGGDGNLSSKIRAYLNKKGIRDKVKMVGWIPHENLPDFLNKLKLLVLPSHTEGLPNVMLEAMACGTPVLATPVGAIPSIIKNRETGFLLRSNDPTHIADRIVKLLSKPNLLEEVSRNAHRWIRANFREENAIDSWRRIFQELGTFQ